MKALLISEDKNAQNDFDALFRAHFHKIRLLTASSGKEGMDYLSYDGPFGVILIDVSLKAESPMELAKSLLDFGGQRPIIFVGTSSLIKSRVSQEMYEMHPINDILFMPVVLDRFKEVINKALEWSKVKEFEQSIIEADKDSYLPVKLRNFYLFDEVPYNVYFEVMKGKFVKIINRDTPYKQSLIQTYVKRNVKYFYVEKQDHLKLLDASMASIKSMLELKCIDPTTEFQIQVKAMGVIHEYLRTVGAVDTIIEFTESILERIFKNSDMSRNLQEILDVFPLVHRDLAEQSVLTLHVCRAILDGLGWNSEIAQRKLGLASIVHDCTLSNDDMSKITSLKDPNLLVFSEVEQEEFRLHAINAARLSSFFNRFSDVEFIIREHHELPDGTGFPNGLTSFKLTPLSATFIIANNFVSELVSRGIRDEVVSLTLRKFTKIYNIGNFKESLKILGQKLNIDII